MGYSKGSRFPADALKAARVGPLLPTHTLGLSILAPDGEDQSRQIGSCSFFPAPGKEYRGFLGSSPLLPHSQPSALSQPCPTLSPVCPRKVPGDTQGAPAVSLPLWPWALSLQSQRLGRGQGKLSPSPAHHLYPLPTTSIPRGKKKKQNKNKKNLLYRDIFLLYKVCTVPKKKRKKKGVHFFHYCR